MKHDDPRIKHVQAREEHEERANQTRHLHRLWKTLILTVDVLTRE